MSRFGNSFGWGNTQPFAQSGVWNPAISRFFNAVYAWMAVGLATTALVAYGVSLNIQTVARVYNLFWVLLIAEVVLVMVIGNAIQRINAFVATVLFVIYSAINGLTLSVLFLVYTQSSLASAFVVTAGMFLAMSVYGMATKRNLTTLGSYLYMALIGLFIAMIVSFFWHNSALATLINFVGVIIFVGLTAFDTQRLKIIAMQTQNDAAMAARQSIIGSLVLYLDFINLFLFLLKFMGNSRRD